ncbi:MAG: tetratricopeptide repeat protein [Prevotellaceae bacterium]|jgi:tetratricopeptide (TPR) repeat protein|nr:tetratricopeptide repeat protein [Prevotellaceae bacterium]
MKKFISIFTMLLIVSAGCTFAQNAKKDVKKAHSKANAFEKPDFDAAIGLIEPALIDETTKNDPYTWWVAADIYDKIIDYEKVRKPLEGLGTTDQERMNESAFIAYDYYLKAVELEKIPDVKGKINTKYTKKAKDMLIWYYNEGLIVNYGAGLGKYDDYKNAVKAFEKHLSIPDLEFIAGTKECPKKDTTNYYNVAYYDAIYTQLAGDEKAAAKKYEAIKNNGYEEYKVYNFLYNIYEADKDTVNFLRILDEGIAHFPKEFFFLGTKINYFIYTNQSDAAIEYLQKAIEIDPTNAQYYNVMGNLYSFAGKRIDAAQNYDKALELEPNNPLFITSKGNLIYSEAEDLAASTASIRDMKQADNIMAAAKAKFNEAKTYYLRAIEIDDKNLEAWEQLRKYYIRFEYESKNHKDADEKVKELRGRY